VLPLDQVALGLLRLARESARDSKKGAPTGGELNGAGRKWGEGT